MHSDLSTAMLHNNTKNLKALRQSKPVPRLTLHVDISGYPIMGIFCNGFPHLPYMPHTEVFPIVISSTI